MKTLKVKSILFSLLAIVATAFVTSCGQMSIEDVEPTLTDEAVFRAVLDASKGKLTQDVDSYIIQLSPDDLDTNVYEALMGKETLTISEGFTISAEDVAEIFCFPNSECFMSGAYTFPQTTIDLGSTPESVESRCWCFRAPSGGWICIC